MFGGSSDATKRFVCVLSNNGAFSSRERERAQVALVEIPEAQCVSSSLWAHYNR